MTPDELDLVDHRSEAALIGAIGFHAPSLAAVLADLPADDFYSPHRASVWDAFRKLSAERKPITPVTVARHLADHDELNDATRGVLSREMAEASPAAMARDHARVVSDLARRREMFWAIKRAAGIVRDHPGDASQVIGAVRAVFEEVGPPEHEATGGTLTWNQLMDEFDAAHSAQDADPGIATPWYELDQMIGGLHPGRMYVVGGSPGDGKSTVALNIALNAALNGHGALVFSKEMPTLDVTGRLIAKGAEINLARINARQLNDLDRARVREFRNRVGTIPLRVNADPVTMNGIAAYARALHHRGHLDLLIVDYLQLMTGDTRGRSAEEEIAKVSTALKDLAMELRIPVVVPAQLNRAHTARADLRPTKSDLRGSGRIEQDADVVILLWRAPIKDDRTDEVKPDPHRLTFIIDKNRHGPKGELVLGWNGGYGAVG